MLFIIVIAIIKKCNKLEFIIESIIRTKSTFLINQCFGKKWKLHGSSKIRIVWNWRRYSYRHYEKLIVVLIVLKVRIYKF